jgi:hypothetical protein
MGFNTINPDTEAPILRESISPVDLDSINIPEGRDVSWQVLILVSNYFLRCFPIRFKVSAQYT